MSNKPLNLNPSCIKMLSAVEARPERSNQHEFNGVVELKNIFGVEKIVKSAFFSIRGQSITDVANVTWYDAREEHPTRTEYRLYFQTNQVMMHAQEGDNILIGYDNGGNLHFILIKQGSSEHSPNITQWTKAS
ncbi:type II restriction endonuclease [Chromobacterium amazonense]|uniref:type II restriction endonuclease n=1 Tax=Chromobacterium amazonense TaxID=1382803 RepID=UPI0009F1BD30|nr:type II restriction endonuclease [Chromobacterium amazonense]